ncbi:myo-inositol 2-dehydrogenase / D-chiro-inositol 1-dehydrogenase [Microlunatus sagamiharensis]|uniref:Myo-inositol 2-dehydrogenase / D-chiro-inositol 1-dehydrogenase n=1 Tax=Microlunatus sagamiharensis TaxID=546874 RepID=A0A1H2MZU2_9ACTN|nr:Gfo/Idh/MocA family oxidoreductase [Microlunatus sagamiharensis]SDU98883.1 myo-inositol 2-dehydrogenase / D-chiro-inositol 1-dehydrogenase [Microlunatus sagamiharensis]
MVVRVGIVGAGIMGADHALTVQRFVSGAEVSLLADPDLQRAGAAAQAVGARAVDDPFGLVASDEVDAVVVASPDATHPALVRACVEAGKPVLCEKPLSPTLADSAALLDDLGERASLVSLGFMRRFDPGYTDLRATLAAGTVGAPVLVHSTGRGVSSAPGATSESAVTNSAVHDLDIVAWLLGSPVTEVSWHAPRQTLAAAFADPQLVLLRTADGVLSTVEMFLNARYGYDVRCEVVGESGTASLREPARTEVDTALAHGHAYGADWRPRFADAYRLELQAWVDGLGGGDAGPLASAHDGLVASAVADAVITSMHTGGAWTPVQVPAVGSVA